MKTASLLIGVVLASTSLLYAAPVYWDINGAAPGAGGPSPSGIWGPSTAYWNSAAAGDGSGTITGWVNGSEAIFSAGSDATGSFTVTPENTVTSFQSLTYNHGGASAVLTIGAGATIQNLSGVITVNGQAGTRLAFNSILTGTQGLTKEGVGILQFNTAIPTYSGDTFITGGTLRLSAAGRLPSATSVDVSTGASLDVRRNTTVSGLSGSGSVFQGESNQVSTLTLNGESTSKTFNGIFTQPATNGVLHLTKTGSYTQILGGTQANLHTGNTTVSGGVLALAKSSGVNAIAGGSVILNTNGTLRLDAAHQIDDGATLHLDGGTLDLNGVAGESFGTALALGANSAIHFGEGTSTLSFAASNAEDWGSFLITITGFEEGSDLLRFGTSSAGLSLDQLALFRFTDYGDAMAQIDSLGYLTPVVIPEPSGAALLIGSLALLGLARRRRGGIG